MPRPQTTATRPFGSIIRAASQERSVARIFVNPAIKRALCREAGYGAFSNAVGSGAVVDDYTHFQGFPRGLPAASIAARAAAGGAKLTNRVIQHRLAEIEALVARAASAVGLRLIGALQSNHEGVLIDRLHLRDFDWVVINPGGLTHTSVSLRDALLAVERPFAELHLSDPAAREPFRRVNLVEDVAAVKVRGHGAAGYEIAVTLIAELRAEARAAERSRA